MPEFNVETMVNIMAKQQADGGKPLSPAQRDTMMQHLKRLCSGTASVPQTVISNHAAALLRSFNNGTPLPPLPAPYSQPAPNLLQAQLMALPPQVRQQLGNMPPHQILAALQQMQMARPMQPAAPAPAQPRLGFTPEQLEVLRTQIIAFRKIKKQEPLQPAELAAIKPPPLPPAYTTPQPAPRPQAVAQAMLSQQQQQLQLQQQQLLAKQNMMRAAGMQAAAMKTPAAKTMPIKPNHPLLPGGPRPAAPPPVVLPLEDPVPPWRGPPPVEYRGNEVVSRAAGPLMTLGAATIEHGGLPAPLAQREKMVPGLMGPLWDLTRILDQEQQTQLIRRRRTRMAELEALLGLSDPSAAKAVARSAHLPLAELAPPLPAPPAALPGSAPHPHPDLKGLAEKGGAAGAGGGGGGLVAVKEEAGPGGQALQPGRTVGVKRAAEEGGGGGGEGLRPMPRLVPGFQPSPEGVPGRGALMLELRKLRLLDLQARLRTEVELEHTTRLGMGQDRDYYRFMKEGGGIPR
ncbi:hypothetical protein QJQ45_011673 [Haematococcus lacustris]|nr:hypothetical protein QJQ45_011673 [Haematococcus lacustris]